VDLVDFGLLLPQASQARGGGPDDVVDVLLAVVGEVGFSWEVASANAVGVIDGAALPGRIGMGSPRRFPPR
jgi:hypothetical protein